MTQQSWVAHQVEAAYSDLKRCLATKFMEVHSTAADASTTQFSIEWGLK